jgi:hypothetical protein
MTFKKILNLLYLPSDRPGMVKVIVNINKDKTRGKKKLSEFWQLNVELLLVKDSLKIEIFGRRFQLLIICSVNLDRSMGWRTSMIMFTARSFHERIGTSALLAKTAKSLLN